MVDMYYRLVKAGLRTIEKVPVQFRDTVMAALVLDGNDNQISTPTFLCNTNNADNVDTLFKLS